MCIIFGQNTESMKKKILLGLLLLLIVMQFFQIDKSPVKLAEQAGFEYLEKPPANITAMLKAACYDCHSFDTEYPWYTNVAPLSFWINGHIKAGREKLNFSNWESYSIEDKSHHLKESAEEIQDVHMPPKTYRWMHSDAKFSKEEKAELVAWLEERARK